MRPKEDQHFGGIGSQLQHEQPTCRLDQLLEGDGSKAADQTQLYRLAYRLAIVAHSIKVHGVDRCTIRLIGDSRIPQLRSSSTHSLEGVWPSVTISSRPTHGYPLRIDHTPQLAGHRFDSLPNGWMAGSLSQSLRQLNLSSILNVNLIANLARNYVATRQATQQFTSGSNLQGQVSWLVVNGRRSGPIKRLHSRSRSTSKLLRPCCVDTQYELARHCETSYRSNPIAAQLLGTLAAPRELPRHSSQR